MTTVTPILTTPDLPRLQAYYEKVFGAEQTERVPPEGDVFYVALRLGDSVLGIVADDSGQRCLLDVAVDDVDALLPVVRDAGGTAAEPNDMPWGQRVAHSQDPDGNTVNLSQPI